VLRCSQFLILTQYPRFFAEHGLEYTPAEKHAEGVPIRDLSELGFLKRKTGWFENRVRVPLMSKDTIYELTNWLRIKDSAEAEDQLRSNIHDASWFMFFYGINEFRNFRTEVNDALSAIGLDKSPDTYDLFYQTFLEKLA